MSINEKAFYQIGLNILEKYDLNNVKSSENFFIVLRGVFDSRGSIISRNILNKDLSCSINGIPVNLIEFIINNTEDINCERTNNSIKWKDYNALDFLSKIYDNSDARFRNKEKYDSYINWVTFGLDTNEIPKCKFFKKHKNAVIPSKSRASDVGYDLTIIEVSKELGKKTFMYDTGIIIAPEFGYYTKIVPRSSITKSGYMLTNSTGIIDPSYRGTLKICLTKVDDSIPNLKLPCKIAQLIIDRSIHYNLEEVSSIEHLGITNRGEGGFGSTDKK
jgi:deoxyuridine 5'-triphosphate nucleotidohydrolase